MLKFLTTFVLLLSVSLAHAEFSIPSQKILGADTPVQVGELVVLSVSPPEKTPNLVSTSYTWKVFDGKQEKVVATDVDGRIFFGTGRDIKSFNVVVAITHLYVEKDGDNVKQIVTKTVLLSTSVAIADDNRPTPVEPEPVEPAKTGLAKFVYDLARSKVNSPSRAKEAKALADSFLSVVATAENAKVIDIKGFFKATATSNAAALKNLNAAEKWAAFNDALEDKLFEMYQDGSLRSPADFAQAWRDIYNGLKDVK